MRQIKRYKADARKSLPYWKRLIKHWHDGSEGWQLCMVSPLCIDENGTAVAEPVNEMKLK